MCCFPPNLGNRDCNRCEDGFHCQKGVNITISTADDVISDSFVRIGGVSLLIHFFIITLALNIAHTTFLNLLGYHSSRLLTIIISMRIMQSQAPTVPL